jgi:homoserine kinase type II
MGVHTTILLEEVNDIFEGMNFINIMGTNDGICETTYILESKEKKYILKLYEKSSIEQINNKLQLIEQLNTLPVTKLESQVCEYFNKPIMLFSYLEGESLKEVNLEQIIEIGKTLGKMHKLTKGKHSSNPNIFTQAILKSYIDENSRDIFKERYQKIKQFTFENHGIIHGDIFRDNTKFVNNKLSGIFDFIDACNGDFRIDLAIVVIDWCFEGEFLNRRYIEELLNSYNTYSPIKIEERELKDYILYIALLYASKRYNAAYIEKRQANIKDYRELIQKFDFICKEL